MHKIYPKIRKSRVWVELVSTQSDLKKSGLDGPKIVGFGSNTRVMRYPLHHYNSLHLCNFEIIPGILTDRPFFRSLIKDETIIILTSQEEEQANEIIIIQVFGFNHQSNPSQNLDIQSQWADSISKKGSCTVYI